MTAANHFLAGAAIGLTVPNPLIGIPLAIASHFVMDAIPHYGCKEFRDDNPGETKFYFLMLIIDGLIYITLTLLAIFWFDNITIALYGFAAFSPDLVWIYRYGLLARIGKVDRPEGKLEKFHYKIQWYEEINGLLVEIPFFIGMGWIVLQLLS